MLSWRLSNSLENSFCIDVFDMALQLGKPYVINTNQGSQYTSNNYIENVEGKGIKHSMDGKGRAIDNIY